MVARGVRWRLAAWNLVILALVLGVTIGTAALGIVRASEGTVERELRLQAATMASRVEQRDDDDHRSAVSVLAGSLPAYGVLRDGTLVASIGDRVNGLPDRADLQQALAGREVLSDRVIDGVPVRLLSIPVLHEGRIVGAAQAAAPLTANQQQATQLLLVLAITGGAGILLAAAGSAFLADRAMRPIEQALEQQRHFIADASHELRTPVAVLHARAEVLEREGATLPAPVRQEVEQLRRDADELSVLMGELLDLARLEAGQAELAVEPIALADVVEELVAQLQPLAERRGVHLAARTTPVWSQANLARTRQVLRALADNALKHTPRDGCVTIGVDRQAEWARLRVEDTGEGIPPEHLERVADRFYRVEASRTRGSGDQPGGTGLGLAIASQLVRLMHGQLRLTSQPGQGTTATVFLPLARPAATSG